MTESEALSGPVRADLEEGKGVGYPLRCRCTPRLSLGSLPAPHTWGRSFCARGNLPEPSPSRELGGLLFLEWMPTSSWVRAERRRL